MKHKFASLILSLIIILSSLFISVSAEDMNGNEHVHKRELQEVCLENIEGINRCGRFYCSECGSTYYDSITYEDVCMPVIDICGEISEVTKEATTPVTISYASKELEFLSNATLKLQGSTSVAYPKKNYTLKFYKEDGVTKDKIKLVDSWGKQSQYCLKANYIDYSQARNIVSGRIMNEIIHSRCIDDELDALSNGGMIDGYPVIVYSNGTFLGLYTLNIPKDKWCYGMNSTSEHQALLFAGTWTDSVSLKATIEDVNELDASGFDLEYCSTEDTEEGTAWVGESFNEFITFLINNNGEDFRKGIGKYTDVDRAIDVLIFTYFIHGEDNVSKNIVWATWDGIKWIPCMYDMDATWGLFWNGSTNRPSNDMFPGGGTLLFSRLISNYFDEIESRYVELREDILSRRSIRTYFNDFESSISAVVRTAEGSKWMGVPSQSSNNVSQIINYSIARCSSWDNYYDKTITEKTSRAYKMTFEIDGNSKVYVYNGQDYSTSPERAISAFSTTSAGALTRSNGQVDFLVEVREEYQVSDIVVAYGTYNSVLTPVETGNNNTYRVTGITANSTIKITTELKPSEEPGYNIEFITDDTSKVYVYSGQDYSLDPILSTKTWAVDSATGEATRSGDGQVNFKVETEPGFKVSSVEISPGSYKNLKDPTSTGIQGVYRITKITGDLSVRINTDECLEHEYIDGKCTLCGYQEPSYQQFSLGDVNADGKINAQDAFLIAQIIIGGQPSVEAADIDQNGKVASTDANLFKRILSGLLEI